MSDLIDINHITSIVKEVIEERHRQEDKWGQQNHDPFKWNAIFVEEVGEVSQAIVEAFNWSTGSFIDKNKLVELRTELIQTVAVGIAMIQSLDRNELGTHTTDEEKDPYTLYHEDFVCKSCSAKGMTSFSYQYMYPNVNKEHWVCKNCNTDLLVREEPMVNVEEEDDTLPF